MADSNIQPSRRHLGQGPDSDGDGLSDDFEARVFGSDPKEADGDGDGVNDWAEWWLDTKPRDADTDGDGWLDGEDLAFGDPLRPNTGGAERRELRDRARAQFDAEGSDRDGDWLRDAVEQSLGTKPGVSDSDGDGLSDGVEEQLRRMRVPTSQDSTPDDTTDLDEARERLDGVRATSDAPPRADVSSDTGSWIADEEPPVEAPAGAVGDAGEASSIEDFSADVDLAPAGTLDGADPWDGGADTWA